MPSDLPEAGMKEKSRLKARVGSIVGATNGWWSQVHHFVPSDAEKAASRGEMVIAVSMQISVGGPEAVAVGREVLGRINEEYYGVLEGSVWERLNYAIGKVAEEVISHEGEEGGEQEVKAREVSLVAGVLWNGVWYVVGSGGGGVWLRRNGEAAVIFEGKSGLWGGSGVVGEGDLILLGTKRFFDLVSGGMVKAALSNGEIEEIVGVIAPIVQGQEGGSGAAAALAEFEGLPELKVATVAEQVEPASEMPEKEGGGSKLKEAVSERVGGVLGSAQGLVTRLRGRSLYVRTYRPPAVGRKGTFILGIVILVVLLLGAILGVRLSGEKELASGPVGQTQGKIAQAQDLVGVDPQRAKGLLDEAKVLVATVGDKKTKDQLTGQINQLYDQAMGIRRLSAGTFVDLSLVRDNIAISSSALGSDSWWGLDAQGGRLVKVSLQSKQANVAAGQDQIGNGQLVASLDPNVLVLSDKGIVEVDPGQGTARTVVPSDREWGKTVDMESFGGNVYLLDTVSGTVWRYLAIEGGLGTKQSWFRADAKPDLSTAVDMAIDGSVWVGFSDGEVKKYTQGALDSFTFPTLDQPIGSLGGIYTTSDLDNLYILDSGVGRVIVVSKQGTYLGQYVAGELKGGKGLVVYGGSNGQVLVTVGSKVLAIQL